MKYNKSIDGLRAIAVLSVLFYHLNLSLFKGGFVGVDVFFIISGYLITQIIKNKIELKQFNIKDFYVKRFLRLYPALLITLVLSFIGAFLFFSPSDFISFSESLTHSVLSSSNIYYYHTAGYFNEIAKYYPLLHTWSLSVEWQFYLFWPFVLIVLSKVEAKYQNYLLLCMFFCSLIYSQYLVTNNLVAAYYLISSRLFEFLLGAFLVFFRISDDLLKKRINFFFTSSRPNAEGCENPPIRKLHTPVWNPLNLLRMMREILPSVLGLIIIIGSIFFYRETFLFPGFLALLPGLGTVLLLYNSDSKNIINNIIGKLHPIGKVSYSIYLVHWPIIIFYSYYKFENIPNLSLIDKGIILCLILFFSVMLHIFVEEKFRKLHVKSFKVSPKPLLFPILIAVLLINSLLVKVFDGYLIRIDSDKLALTKNPMNFHELNYGGVGYALESILGNKEKRVFDAAIIGDSFALQLSRGLEREFKDKKIYGMFHHGCIFGSQITNFLYGKPDENCYPKYQKFINFVNDNGIHQVFYAINYQGYVNSVVDLKNGKQLQMSEEEFTQFFIEIIKKMQKSLPNSKITLIAHGPGIGALKIDSCLLRPKFFPSKCESKFNITPDKGHSYNIHSKLKEKINALHNVNMIDGYKPFCFNGKCYAMINNEIMYSDGLHLSISGSFYFVKFLKQEFMNNIG